VSATSDASSSAPRIPPLPPEEWGDDVRAGLAALRPSGATQELRYELVPGAWRPCGGVTW